MHSSAFIFAAKAFDAEFHRLDQASTAAAVAPPGERQRCGMFATL